ncbi:hypothetical protein BSKO_13473 [Bryopsis sp. KO-2023]|nr:hypothetical protein BSKO_13473 [Bryopsis sp. KO-2023]
MEARIRISENSDHGRRGSLNLEPQNNKVESESDRGEALEVFRDSEPWEYWWKLAQRLGFLAAVVLSILGVTARHEGWFKLDSGEPLTRVRVGWRYACINERFGTGRVPCSAHDKFQYLGDAVSNRAGHMAVGLIVAIFASWVLPIMACTCVAHIQSSTKRVRNCWHGCATAFAWIILGSGLVALCMTFWSLVEHDVESSTTSALDVLCDGGRVVCEGVLRPEDCPVVSCRTGEDSIACVGFESCESAPVKTSCDSPFAVCELDPGFAFFCTIATGGVWVFLGLITLAGSIRIGRKL